MPPSAKLSQGREQWQYLSGRFVAPQGRLITAVKFLCLNYRNLAPAWFDDLVLTASYLDDKPAEITIVAGTSEKGRQRQALLQDALQQLDHPVAVVPAVPSPDDCRLLVVPEWNDDARTATVAVRASVCGDGISWACAMYY